ncbi:M50 family metallopeptidase [Candidatus Woesearchaeota archaeon]|nr:M50 family metallopeptidase [Candidatus Woesearchaeota archaeon]
MGEYIARLKQYYPFTKKELKDHLIVVVAFAFMIGFDDGSESFQLGHWLVNFLLTAVVVALVILIHETGHRMFALGSGYRSDFNLWPTGLIIGLIVTFITRGKFWILIPGGLVLHHMTYQRLGGFRYGLSTHWTGVTALFGPIYNIVAAMLVKQIMNMAGIEQGQFPLVDLFILINFAYAAYSLIPIPPLDGFFAFMGSRLTYIFGFAAAAGYVILYVLGVFSLIGALVIAGIVWWVFYTKVEAS